MADHGLIIEVSDSGIGIDSNNLEKIYDEFWQEQTDTRRSYEGTGLGLTMTKRIIDLMAGQITVESELNKGTKFKVFLNAE